MRIYTKTGDRGETSLFGGRRVSKSSQRIELLGNIDELNSILGIAKVYISNPYKNFIEREQSNLLRLGSDVATDLKEKEAFQAKILRITSKDVETLESEIDIWDNTLPQLTTFILPGDNKPSAFIHHARSICRKCERCAVELSLDEEINEFVLKYLNRLSDWLFVLARKNS